MITRQYGSLADVRADAEALTRLGIDHIIHEEPRTDLDGEQRIVYELRAAVVRDEEWPRYGDWPDWYDRPLIDQTDNLRRIADQLERHRRRRQAESYAPEADPMHGASTMFDREDEGRDR